MDALLDSRGGPPLDGGPLRTDSLRPGQKLGRYTLLTPVAQGGMARVWAARQVGTRGFQKIVAIKTIMPALAADPEFEHMFLDEARIAAAIHHPNVCEILDLGEEGSVLFLAMEWVDGVSLLALIKARPKTPLPDPIAVRIIADACAGLHSAHEIRSERGELVQVVHRDVSPHNILVAHDGTVKVADFGVAKAMGLEHAPTMAGQLKGKVAYMSPEQAVGDISVDRRSDIFSLGAVLYEAVTGHRAWPGANDVARLQSLLAGDLIPPRQLRPDIPPDLEAILSHSLTLDPQRRFQTAEQMRVALEQFLVARNLIVTPSDVASVVRELSGREIEERRARIHHASSLINAEEPVPSAPSAAPAPASLGAISLQTQVPLRPRGMRRTTALVVSLLFGGLTVLGLSGIVVVNSLPKRTSGPLNAQGLVATANAAADSAQAPRPATLLIIPTPDTALVEVNGVVIGSGRRSLARPRAGELYTVVVRAAGYEPTTITIDQNATQTEWPVELRKQADAETSPSAPASTPAAVPAPPPPTPPPAAVKQPAAPANPQGPVKLESNSAPKSGPKPAGAGDKPTPTPRRTAPVPTNPY